jgi:hypothetical protein
MSMKKAEGQCGHGKCYQSGSWLRMLFGGCRLIFLADFRNTRKSNERFNWGEDGMKQTTRMALAGLLALRCSVHAGNDILAGGKGSNLLDGGEGDDGYYFTRGDGNSGDEIHLDGFDPADALHTSPIQRVVFEGTGRAYDMAQLLQDIGFDLDGTAQADRISGTSLNDRISTFEGDDYEDGSRVKNHQGVAIKSIAACAYSMRATRSIVGQFTAPMLAMNDLAWEMTA